MNRIKSYRVWSPEELAELRRLIRAKVPHAAIAEKLNRSVKAISAAVYKFDMPIKRNRSYAAMDVAQVRQLAARGYSDRIIGLTIGRTRSAISQIRERRNIAAGNPLKRPNSKAARAAQVAA